MFLSEVRDSSRPGNECCARYTHGTMAHAQVTHKWCIYINDSETVAEQDKRCSSKVLGRRQAGYSGYRRRAWPQSRNDRPTRRCMKRSGGQGRHSDLVLPTDARSFRFPFYIRSTCAPPSFHGGQTRAPFFGAPRTREQRKYKNRI